MSTLVSFLLAAAMWNSRVPDPQVEPCREALAQDSVPQEATPRLVIQKSGGPGHGPDQPYAVREQGAKDLEGFIGGRQVVFVGPYDVLLLILMVSLVVVLILVI